MPKYASLKIPDDLNDRLESLARENQIVNSRLSKGNRTALIEALIAYFRKHPPMEPLVDLVPPRPN